ncbi:hypothetical protein NG798_00425 [Ancylothrix sp. C2]|uniref:hypothetical protein n=1 Tax=Ancylothrix sp. D3o TaxID=2953691 RepID=UPI0021BAF230|nr:hypothetical protein [Ancylothrix sp. D3o]MCT7948257.1 hypothetical protein [Ancylothrix sp. D3o]
MALSLLENLDSLNPQVALSDFTTQLSQPETIFSKVKPQLPNFAEFKDKLNLPNLDLSDIQNKILSVPLSPNELRTELTVKFNSLTTMNLESLSAAIPLPSAETFKNVDLIGEVKSTMESLTQDLSFNLDMGDLPPVVSSMFGEFNEVLNRVEMLPTRTFNALLKIFENLLEKLSNPDELLSQLGSASLSSIFNQQIIALTEKLPSQAIKSLETNINQRREYLAEYQAILNELADPSNLDESTMKELRQKLRQFSVKIEKNEEKIQTAITNLNTFTIESFTTAINQLSQVAATEQNTLPLLPLFEQIQTYLDTINDKVADITAKLRQFTQQIPQLIDTAISKAEELATQATTAITQTIDTGKQVLNQVKDFLSDAIRQIKEFIDQVCAEAINLIKPVKQVCNQASTFLVQNIDTIAGQIQTTTEQLRSAIGEVNGKIETHLNREALEFKINQLLDKVSQVLDSPQVNQVLQEAEDGLKIMTDSLEKVSLKPAFKAVLDKTSDVEKKLRKVDVSKFSAPARGALKVGTLVIKQVDIRGIVNPELKEAFAEILEPIENVVVLIEGEANKITDKIEAFQPGTLIEQFVQPYLDIAVEKINEYKPSILLQPVKDFYHQMLEKMDAINPQHLIDKLEELYQKLVKVIESLSPTIITDFLNKQLQTVTQTLDNIPVEALVQKVTEGLNQVDKLMDTVGLADVLQTDLWLTLEKILSFSFTGTIKKIEALRDRVIQKINPITKQQLNTTLKQLEEAIIDYVETQRQANIGFDLSSLQAAESEYAPVMAETQTQWEEKKALLAQYNPSPELRVYYQDLVERLQKIYDKLNATKPNQINQQVEQLLRDNLDRLKPNKPERRKLNENFNSQQILDNFKHILPEELNRQLITPLTNLLTSLDKLISQPRAVLGDIKLTIQKVDEAPRKLAEVLRNLATNLGNQIRDSINAVKTTVSSLVGEVVTALEDTYNNVVNTVKTLSPHRILNRFEESDFLNFDNFLQKLAQSQDGIAAYIKSRMTENTQSLLSVNEPGTKLAVIRDLNNLLLDESLYTSDRFQGVTLSSEAQKLAKGNYRNNIVHFNRVLVESIYSGELIMNVESIFPYLQNKLAEIYPQKIVDELDKLHERIVQLIQDMLKAVASALDGQYQKKIVKKSEALRQAIKNLFQGLKNRLKQIQAELDIGLEDVADAFDRLLNAIPV